MNIVAAPEEAWQFAARGSEFGKKGQEYMVKSSGKIGVKHFLLQKTAH